MLRGIPSQSTNDCIIQAVFFFHRSVKISVLFQLQYLFLCSAYFKKSCNYFHATYIKNYGSIYYWYTLLVWGFKNTKDKSLKPAIYVSFYGQQGGIYNISHLILPSTIFFSRKAVKLLSGITSLFHNCCSTPSAHFPCNCVPDHNRYLRPIANFNHII